MLQMFKIESFYFFIQKIGLSAKTPRELLMKAGELLGEHKKMKDKVKRLEREVKHLEKHKGQQVSVTT